MTLYQVPHLALGAEMTENFHERTRIVAYRQFFGTAGGAVASIVGLGYFFSDAIGGRLAVENYTPYAITLGVLMVVTIFYSAWGTQKEVPFLRIRRQSRRLIPWRKSCWTCVRDSRIAPSGGCSSVF